MSGRFAGEDPLRVEIAPAARLASMRATLPYVPYLARYLSYSMKTSPVASITQTWLRVQYSFVG